MPEAVSHQADPVKIESLVGRLRKTYIFALTLLGFLLISLELVTQYSLLQQTEDARIVNMSGRQRMRSQRLIKEILLEKTGAPNGHMSRAMLTGARLSHTHLQLQSFVHTPASREVYDRLTPLVQTLFQASELKDPSKIDDILPDLLRAETDFLPLMDRLVGVFESEARERVSKQRAWQFAILAFLLLTLFLEGLYVFAPMVRSLSGALEKLQEANRATQEALLRSEAAERLKSRFLTSVSHELKTPMNGILGTSDLLMDCRLSSQASSYVEVIQKSAEQLLAMVNDILDISNLESGDLKLKIGGFSLQSMLDEVSRRYGESARARGLEFEARFDEELPRLVEGDSARVRQIIDNLLSNAIKYTEKGKVNLEVTVEAQGIKFSVGDTGPGIPSNRLEEMFQPFRQLDEGATRKYQGVGLGLPLVNMLLGLHGERLEVTSTEGEGTTFVFRLPLKAVSLDVPGEALFGSESRIMDNIGFRFEGKVLVVEDNETNQMICQRMLRKVGVEVDVACNGEEALEMWAAGCYDLIFMDLQVPVMDGTKTAGLIREKDSTTPIVALTANTSSQDREECEKAGMNGFLTKPLRAKALRDLLIEHLKFELTDEQSQSHQARED